MPLLLGLVGYAPLVCLGPVSDDMLPSWCAVDGPNSLSNSCAIALTLYVVVPDRLEEDEEVRRSAKSVESREKKQQGGEALTRQAGVGLLIMQKSQSRRRARPSDGWGVVCSLSI